jgi:hypothetical protein
MSAARGFEERLCNQFNPVIFCNQLFRIFVHVIVDHLEHLLIGVIGLRPNFFETEACVMVIHGGPNLRGMLLFTNSAAHELPNEFFPRKRRPELRIVQGIKATA